MHDKLQHRVYLIVKHQTIRIRCKSASGLVVGDMEHLADTPSSAREAVSTGALGVYGCSNNDIL